jgi:hypothetical protein
MERTTSTAMIGRRSILAIGAAVVAGIAAKGTVQPVAAAVTATNFSAEGPGIVGFATNGTFQMGVTATGTDQGIFGSSAAGTGIVAIATSGDGLVARTFGTGESGKTGVTGRADGEGNFGVAGIGIRGSNGVYGRADDAGTTHIVAGVFGESTTTYGIIGRTTAEGYSGLTAITSTPGVAALAATSTNPNAYAAYFTGTTVVQGNFAVVGGNKSAAVKDAAVQHRLVYCVESPESWFEDFGKGTLVNGKAAVTLDPVFAQIAHTDDYHIFLTEYGATNHIFVASQAAGGFVVQAETAGAAGTFSYRVVARRADIKGERLAKFDPPKIHIPDESKLQSPALPKAAPSPLPATKR